MACWCMNKFKLPICSFSFEGWKVGWCGEGIDDHVNVFGSRRKCFRESGPLAPSASRANGDVGVGVLDGESDERADGAAIDVENVQ